MRTRVDRLRIWLVVGASLLVLVVGGFLGFARYRSKLFLAGLPGRLGMDITRETDGYTYSQTVEGRTVFTLRAAKMEQRKDGLVKLHDVGVVVYGREQDRADRIYGKEFEYDQVAGIVRALGVVNLDLQAPAPAEGKKQAQVSVTGASLASTDARVIHVTTSGLVYLTKLGVAATAEDVSFSEGQMTGKAHGADFNSDTGIVVLQSEVRVNGLTANGPMVLTASRAELDRGNQVANLAGARLVTTAETVDAEQAVIHVRKDGSPEQVEGSGKVTILRAEGGVLHAERAEATINAASKPVEARFGGGVQFQEDRGGRHAEGHAAEVHTRFDSAGQADHLSLTGGVTMAERDAGTATKPASHRTLAGMRVEVALGPAAGAGRKTEVREAEAFGSARLVMVTDGQRDRPRAAGATTTDLAGDEMKARFAGGQRIAGLVASGHTMLHQVDAAGVDEQSAGDTTELVFRPVSAGQRLATDVQGDLESALQTGHVAMMRTVVKQKAGTPVRTEQRGTSERAEFDADTDRVTLTGNVLLKDTGSMLWAARVVVERRSGDATAEGGVRATYLQAEQDGKEAEPIHILADHAALRQGGGGIGNSPAKEVPSLARAGTDLAFFYGNAIKPARLWQGGSQVEAPMLEFEQETRRLTANAGPDAIDHGPQVHAVLVPSGERSARPVGGKATDVRRRPEGAVRITSREMVYTDGPREVVFTGSVLVEDADGRMRANRATAFLQARGDGSQGAGAANRPVKPAVPSQGGSGAGAQGAKASSDAGGLFGGGVDRIVATEHVELDQPGRHGTGDRLVYTASDGMFVLTGTSTAPPRLTDEARGTVTGASLRFHSGDDSVVVTSGGIQTGSDANVARKQVRTETRVKQQ